jgi:hypothetical protein
LVEYFRRHAQDDWLNILTAMRKATGRALSRAAAR